MTEAEWLTTDDPGKLLHAVQGSRPSERKIRLFNAAVCRRFWGHLPEASRAILSESERLADGLVRSKGEMDLCHRANEVVSTLFDRSYPTKQYPSAEVRIQRDAAAAACYAVIPNELWGAVGYFWDLMPSEKGPHSAIIRDVFGNPFRSVTVEPALRMPEVIALAERIYDGRAFDRMPLLGDALEGAGCYNSDVLAHCRSQAEHVRGCWVVDTVLGKT
jgi:hypothetical protein